MHSKQVLPMLRWQLRCLECFRDFVIKASCLNADIEGIWKACSHAKMQMCAWHAGLIIACKGRFRHPLAQCVQACYGVDNGTEDKSSALNLFSYKS